MHKHTNAQFGFTADNYIGYLPQHNNYHNTWASFFVHNRLMPMVQMAFDKRLLTSFDAQLFERLYLNLYNLFDEEPPALLHGDLWSGNYLIGIDGKPYLIDPAVCYGNREFDIAMTTLFGGFTREFYNGYQEVYPLLTGWEHRLALWNLYPLLVHLNLFGGSYLGQVQSSLKKYV